jgi:hypothetical protein
MTSLKDLRNNKKFRLGVIIFLMIVCVILYFRNVNTSNLNSVEGIKSELGAQVKPDTWEKKILLGAFSLLGISAGLEATENDFDLKKLVETKSFSESRVLRDKKGNIVKEGTPEAANAKYTDEYDCKDFATQQEAQEFYHPTRWPKRRYQ